MKSDYKKLDQAAAALGCPCLKDEPMARHTTFRIGGPADRFLTLRDEKELSEILAVLRDEEIPGMLLGRGSNLLVSDKGIRGAVLALDGKFKEISLLEDSRTLRAGAAASLSSLCAAARENRLSGLEFAWGIPGSVGGAVYMDAGAYGGEMKDVVRSVTHMTFEGGLETVQAADLDFGYRKSRYTGRKDAILFAEFRLEPGDPAEIAARMEDLMGRRREKQPYDMPSAGSVFKRPENGFAAALIEECGLKGRQVGGAQVSPKHAGFIVNTGGASCRDVQELIDVIRREVEAKKGVRLECEVRVTGEE